MVHRSLTWLPVAAATFDPRGTRRIMAGGRP